MGRPLPRPSFGNKRRKREMENKPNPVSQRDNGLPLLEYNAEARRFYEGRSNRRLGNGAELDWLHNPSCAGADTLRQPYARDGEAGKQNADNAYA